MKKFYKELSAVIFSSLFFCAQSFAFTDLLPVGAASDTIPVSNGSGWTLQQLPSNWSMLRGTLGGNGFTTTGGTAYSNGGNDYLLYISSAIQYVPSVATVASTFNVAGAYNYGVGTSTIPAAWFTYPGKTIRITGKGFYSTNATVSTTWQWGVSLATGSLALTPAIQVPLSSTGTWSESCLLTVLSTGTGGIGTVLGSIDVTISSGVATAAVAVVLSSSPIAGVSTINFGNGVAINPTVSWSAATGFVQVNNYIIELMN